MKKIPEFKISLAEPAYLKDSIDLLNNIVVEATFKVGKDYIEVNELDPANVAQVRWKLLSSACIEYDVKKSFNFCLNVSSLLQVLRNAKSDDIIELTNSKEDPTKIIVWFKNLSKREYTIPVIESEDTREKKLPDLTFKTKVKYNAALFCDQIKEVGTIATSTTFDVSRESFDIRGEADISKVRIENNSSDDVVITTDGKFQTKYSIEYLSKIAKCKKVSSDVTLEFSKDYPLKVTYQLIDKLSFEWILAPRVGDE